MGGFLAVSTTIHGTAASPGIPFSDSSSGGIFETASNGMGISESGIQITSFDAFGFEMGENSIVISGVLVNIYQSPVSTLYPLIATSSPDGNWLFIGGSTANNAVSQTIRTFKRNLITGGLVEIVSSPFGLIGTLAFMAVSPDGKYLVVYCQASTPPPYLLRVYSINHVTGELSALADYNYGSPDGVLSFDLSGKYLFAPDVHSLHVFNFNSGAITETVGSPYNLGAGLLNVQQSPDGDFLYAIYSNSIKIFSFNSTTGGLNSLSSMPTLGIAAQGLLTVDGNFLYIINNTTANIDAYVRSNITGNLSFSNSYAAAGGIATGASVLSTDNGFLFVANHSGNHIAVYARNKITGALTPTPGSPFLTVNNPQQICLSPDNLFLYVPGLSSALNIFSTGNLSGYPLVTGNYDQNGGAAGTFNVNGALLEQNVPVLNVISSDLRYAQIAGAIGQPFAAKSVTLDHIAGGLVGTNTNNNALAGMVGEFISASVASGAAVPLTTAVAANVTSIALTDGDWDVEGVIAYHSSGTTNVNDVSEGISTASATLPVAPGAVHCDYLTIVVPAAPDAAYQAPKTRISLAAPATVYLVALSHFTTSTLSAYGQISARRVR